MSHPVRDHPLYDPEFDDEVSGDVGLAKAGTTPDSRRGASSVGDRPPRSIWWNLGYLTNSITPRFLAGDLPFGPGDGSWGRAVWIEGLRVGSCMIFAPQLVMLRVVEAWVRGDAGSVSAPEVPGDRPLSLKGEKGEPGYELEFRRVGPDSLRVGPGRGRGRVVVSRGRRRSVRIQIAPPPPRATRELGGIGYLAIMFMGWIAILAMAYARWLGDSDRRTEIVILRGGWLGLARRPRSDQGYVSFRLSEMSGLRCERASERDPAPGAGPSVPTFARPLRYPTIAFEYRGATHRFGDDLTDEEAAYVVGLVGRRMDAATVELLDFPSAIAARATGRSPAESPVAGRSSGWGAIVLWLGLAMSLGGVVSGAERLKDLIREGPRTNYGVILGQGSVRGDLGMIRGDRGWVGYRMESEGMGPAGWNGGTSGGTIFLSSPGAKFVDVVGFGEVHGRIEEMETRGLGVALRGESAWTATSLLVAAGLVQSTLWAIALGLAVMRRRAAWACLVLMACGDLVEAAIWLQLETWHATAVGSLAFPILMLLVLTRPEVRAYFDPAFDPSPPETVKLAKPGRSQAWADLA